PVREALRRLIAEGLVEGIKHHSPVVRGVGKLMFKQMFEVRAILEGFAARRAAQHIGISGNAKWVAQQLKFWSGNRIRSDTSFVQANTEFHSGILRIADHEILGQQITQLAIPGYKAVFRPIMTDKDIALSCKQHVRVLTAIAEGDARSAEKIMIDHVMDTSERVTAFYDNALFDRRLRELERLKRED
ncbi:MAG: GntR family transcriptional regulator, partial [Rhodospirillaceae bacterium]|nr:GntR family transcriptional regulator [Rhodospirillaceae bacterium]